MIEGKDINDLVDRTELFQPKEKKKFNMLKFILICIGLSLLLLWVTSCKKKEAKPLPPPAPPPAQQENLWLLGGDWKPTAHQYADTVFGPNLHIHKCCDDPNGYDVYYISYNIWKNKGTFKVPSYWSKDSLWFDNGIVGAGGKYALFVRIK